jgi:DUF917 family protein
MATKTAKEYALQILKKYSGTCDSLTSIAYASNHTERGHYCYSTIAKSLGQLKKEGFISVVGGKLVYKESATSTTISAPGCPTKQQVLESAATSFEAKKALEKLFPQYFEKAKPVLHTFAGGTGGSDSLFDELKKTMKTLRIESTTYVVNGASPTSELKMKTFTFANVTDVDVVIYNAKGKEVLRQKGSDRSSKLYIGFEKQTAK